MDERVIHVGEKAWYVVVPGPLSPGNVADIAAGIHSQAISPRSSPENGNTATTRWNPLCALRAWILVPKIGFIDRVDQDRKCIAFFQRGVDHNGVINHLKIHGDRITFRVNSSRRSNRDQDVFAINDGGP